MSPSLVIVAPDVNAVTQVLHTRLKKGTWHSLIIPGSQRHLQRRDGIAEAMGP
jgi:hypothetical protein